MISKPVSLKNLTLIAAMLLAATELFPCTIIAVGKKASCRRFGHNFTYRLRGQTAASGWSMDRPLKREQWPLYTGESRISTGPWTILGM